MSKLSFRRLAILAIAFCVLGSASRVQADVDPAEGRAVAQALSGEGPLRQRLERLRPLPAEAFLELLRSGRVPGEWFGSGSSGRPLGAEEHQGLLGVLTDAPFRTLQPHLNAIARTAPDWPPRALAMRLLWNARHPEAIHLLIELSIPVGDSLVVPRSVREVFVDTLRRLLANDTRNVGALRPVLSRVPPGLMTGVFDVLESFPASTVLELIAVTLNRTPELDPLLLTLAARHAARGEKPFDVRVTEAVRPYLTSVDTALLSPAARAAGGLGDYQAVSALIELLKHDDEGVVYAACGALVSITDLTFPAEYARWEGWYEEELRWWNERADQVLLDIRMGSPEKSSKALNELATKRLYRDDLARALVEALPHADGGRGEAICAVLLRMEIADLYGPVRDIVRNHQDARVRESAGDLLERMTR